MLHVSAGLTAYLCFLALLLGSCMGSFLNCLACRTVRGESVLKGRSHCDVCGHVLSFADLIPIFGFIINRGRCRYCGERLSKRHLIAELSVSLCFLAALLRLDVTLRLLEAFVFISVMAACAFADLEDSVMPNRFIITGFSFRVLSFFLLLKEGKNRLVDCLIGGFAVALALLAVCLLYERIKKVEALGGGDIKLIFLTGLYLGWKENILCLLLACVLGIVFALATAKTRDKEMFPWGPSIAVSAVICYLYGGAVINAYLSLF